MIRPCETGDNTGSAVSTRPAAHSHGIRYTSDFRTQTGLSIGMCGMDFSSSVRFLFGCEKNRGFGSVLKKKRWFGFLCRLVVKYKKRVNWRAQLLSQYCTVLTVLSHGVD